MKTTWKGLRLVDVILHIGAHRTASKTFQKALSRNQQHLMQNDTVFWGPEVTRNGMFSGFLMQNADNPVRKRRIARNMGAVALELTRLRANGTRRLIVSEENILGSMIGNVKARSLYPDALDRLTLFADAFGTVATGIVLSLRDYAGYWTSTLAYGYRLGWDMPPRAGILATALEGRGWRDVVGDIRTAFPTPAMTLWDYATIGGKPDQQLASVMQPTIPPYDLTHNQTPAAEAFRDLAVLPPGYEMGADGFRVFDQTETTRLNARYAGDLAWFRDQAGALGLYTTNAGAAPAQQHIAR